MKDFFPLKVWAPKCGCALYMGAHYTRQNTVRVISEAES